MENNSVVHQTLLGIFKCVFIGGIIALSITLIATGVSAALPTPDAISITIELTFIIAVATGIVGNVLFVLWITQ